jgi:hypothetical protein
MSRIRRLLCSLVLPAIGLCLAIFAIVPDLAGIGAPGFGSWEISLLVAGIVFIFANLVLPVRTLAALETMLRGSKVGWREILLLSLSVVMTGVTVDIVLGYILQPTHIAKSKYGWTTPANRVEIKAIEDTTGQLREVTVRYFQNGFKRWGNTDTEKRKVFVIGDSFTEAVQVSNGEEWYSYLEHHLSNVELFVYGAGGFGTLQEYMVLDDYIDSIDPDLILWQFCSNDYYNNMYELELWAYPYSNNAIRPYLEEDRIVYRLAVPYEKLRQYSFIADRLLNEYDRFMWRREQQDPAAYKRRKAEQETEHDVARRKLLIEKANYVTLEIMAKVKNRAKETPVYLFNPCNNNSKYDEKIASEVGIVFLSGIAEYVNEKREGRDVKVHKDGHWNKLGHQLAGEKLVRIFRELDILDK